MNALPNRLEQLLGQNSITGIDFIYVDKNQVELNVYFFQHDGPPQAPDILGQVLKDQVRIYSLEGLPDVPVIGTAWMPMVDGRDVLHIDTSMPGDFASYRLKISSDKIDPYYNDLPFSFKAGCHSDLDCRVAPHECPPEEWPDYPVDYRGRDFTSFRSQLLDFASQRYPDWQDRLEADLGIMLAEVMSALGDEMSYYQDRIAREAYLESASQRRSLRHHARLVDYEIGNGLAASTWLDITVVPGQVRAIPAGADVWAEMDSGKRISYEVGHGLAEQLSGRSYLVRDELNTLQVHIWDEGDTCLPWGTTRLDLEGNLTAGLVFDDPPDKLTGKWAMLVASPVNPGDPERRWPVRITNITAMRDDVLSQDVTRIEWEQAQATPFDLDLTVLTVHANLVPATAGRTVLNHFVIGEEPGNLGLGGDVAASLVRAVERQGPDGSINYLCSLVKPGLLKEDQGKPDAQEFLETLVNPESSQLTWLGEAAESARPEIHLEEVVYAANDWQSNPSGQAWKWQRSFVGVNASQSEELHYTLEDGTWERVVGYWRQGEEIVHRDYRTGEGFTIRFGDGEFGLPPSVGTIFQAKYRLGNGRETNLPADALTNFDPALNFIQAVTNPQPATNGVDPESLTQVRQQAPQAFRSTSLRAVRPEDYAAALEQLDWVQRASARQRWTGSWLTIFAAPDPLNMWSWSNDQRIGANQQLDRYRQAGREAWAVAPRYVDLDLQITVCIQPYAYAGEVKPAILEALFGRRGPSPKTGFFSPDNFSFGDPLQRAALDAAIQSVPGVRAVETVQIRRRGWFDWRDFQELAYQVAKDEVVCIANDPLHPGRGIVQLFTEGGA
ncbi:MAG: hypothetical protein ABSF99_01065 [Anaerolineales bacterium]|jgi:hypothetical protein